MALIPYPDPQTLHPDVQEILTRAPQNITRAFTGTGDMFPAFMTFATAFYSKSALGNELRELLTVRIGHRLNARYVLDQHALMARGAGVSEEKMTAVEGALPSPVFTDEENAALEFIDVLVDHIKAPPEAVLKAYKALGTPRLQELFLVAGFYHMSAQFTESLELELDAQQKGNALEYMKSFA